MSEFRFACPHCGQRMEGNAAYRGREITCSAFGKSLTVPNPVARTPIAEVTEKAFRDSMRPGAAGISSLALLSLVVSFGLAIGCLPAIVLGHLARARIRRNPALGGKRLAMAGLAIGYIMLVLTLLWLVTGLLLLKPKHGQQLTAHEQAALTPAVMAHRLVDEVKLGDADSEAAHDLASRNSGSGPILGKVVRDASHGGFFSYSMQVDPVLPMCLDCTYWGNDANGRRFDILVDDQVIATQALQFNDPGHFFDVIYQIPQRLTRGRAKVTVVFQAYPRQTAGGLFGLKMLRP